MTSATNSILQAGLEALEAGHFEEAEIAIASCPEVNSDPDICYRLGVAQCMQKRLPEAISTWKQTLRMDAMHTDALYDLAVAYVDTGNTALAITTFSRLLSFYPDHEKGGFNLGNLLYRIGRTDEAIAVFASMLEKPNPPSGVMTNLGRALRRAGRLHEADACYRRLLLQVPDDHFVHWNRSHTLFLLGQWEEGFAAWEHRLQSGITPPITPNLPEWTGGEMPLPNDLLLIGEQGHGDMIQCLRYIPPLLQQGCTPTLMVHEAIVSWFQELYPDLTVIAFNENHTATSTMWAPFFSLPPRLGLPNPTDTTPPCRDPVLTPRIASYRPQHVSKTTPLKIGLAWAGNPGHDNDRWRSMNGKYLKPIISEFPDIGWHRLQIGKGEDDLSDAELDGLLTPPPAIYNFADTAKLIGSMDLVICVDTAVAHVAGTLGVPCWLMLAAEPDWRWQENTSTTPWYPETRLFRQETLGDWPSVLNQITTALLNICP